MINKRVLLDVRRSLVLWNQGKGEQRERDWSVMGGEIEVVIVEVQISLMKKVAFE